MCQDHSVNRGGKREVFQKTDLTLAAGSLAKPFFAPGCGKPTFPKPVAGATPPACVSMLQLREHPPGASASNCAPREQPPGTTRCSISPFSPEVCQLPPVMEGRHRPLGQRHRSRSPSGRSGTNDKQGTSGQLKLKRAGLHRSTARPPDITRKTTPSPRQAVADGVHGCLRLRRAPW